MEHQKKSSTVRGRDKRQSRRLVVGIGTSAGGLEALRALLPFLPSEEGMTFVVVSHMDPRHKSLLAELLSPHTSMPVIEIEHGMELKPDFVYITPANANVTLDRWSLRLSSPYPGLGPKPSVDLFFRSLAQSFGERSVGIILSGTGSDGAEGIRAIKAEGGFTLVQTDDSARFNGMPRSAIETGNVDIVASLPDIGRLLPGMQSGAHTRELASKDEHDGLRSICEVVFRKTGADFRDYEVPTFMRRVQRRMKVLGQCSLEGYLEALTIQEGEAFTLYRDLLISVTAFFRDKDIWEALREHLRRILVNKPKMGELRI